MELLNLKFDLAADLKHMIRRQSKVGGGSFRISGHLNKQPVTPPAHADGWGWYQSPPSDKKGGLLHVNFQMPVLYNSNDGLKIGGVHESIPDQHPVKALAQFFEADSFFCRDIGHAFESDRKKYDPAAYNPKHLKNTRLL
jgi:hypothetical protein